MSTPVIFRNFPDGDVIAFFPTEIGAPGYIMSYQKIGQHGDASPELIDELEVSTEEQYRSLKLELETIGYKLGVLP